VTTPIQNITIPSNLSGQFSGRIGSVQAGPEGSSFKDFLVQSIREVNSMQTDADQAVESMATGGDVSAAEVLTAVQKADIAFRMMMQVRNKMVQAFEEVQNLRI
jgi:flagellar hook-basal body complex protein FliE